MAGATVYKCAVLAAAQHNARNVYLIRQVVCAEAGLGAAAAVVGHNPGRGRAGERRPRLPVL